MLGRAYHIHWLLLALVLSVIGAVVAWDSYTDHARIDAEERERLQRRLTIIEQNLQRQLKATDRSLALLRNDLLLYRREPDATTLINRRLQAITEAIPGVRSMLIVNAEGVSVVSNRPELIGINLREGERYRLMSKEPDPDKLFIAPPFVTPLGTYAISAGKVLLDAEGKFAGYILAVIDPDFFSTLLGSLIFTPDIRVAVIHSSGKLIYRVPDEPKLTGKNIALPESLFSEHMESGRRESIVSGTSKVTGENRVTLVRTVQLADVSMSAPLIISASRKVSAIFSVWRDDLYLRIALFCVLLLGSSFSLVYIHSRQRNFDRMAAEAESKRRQAEESLRQSEEHLAITLRSIGDGVIVTDPTGRVTQMNTTAEKLTGWMLAEAKGRPMTEVFHIINTDSRAEVDDPVQKVIESGDIIGLANHTALIARDGREYQIADSAAPIRKADNSITGVVLVFSDVTEQYRVQRALQERETLLRILTERAHVGMVMISAERRYVFANAAYSTVLGRNANDLIGKSVGEVWPKTYESQLKPRLDRAFEGRGGSYDVMVPSVDGTNAERWYSISIEAAVETSYGLCVIVLGTDITERKQAEALHMRLAAAVEGSNDAIFIRDMENRIVYWNDSAVRLYGYTREEVLGKVDAYALSAQDKVARQKLWDRLHQGLQVETFHAIRGHKDGTLKHVSISSSPIRDQEGKIIGMLAVTRDISERIRATDELERSRATLKAALESMADAVFISDVNGRFIEFNEAFATFHKFKSKAECAATLAEYSEFLEVSQSGGPPLPVDQWAVPRALRGESGSHVEFTLRRKDTGESWVGSYTYAPIRDHNGTITGSVVTGRDVTELKRAEATRERLATIIEQSHDAIISRSLDGTILSWNAAAVKMFGYTAEEAIGKSIELTMLSRHPTNFQANNEAALRGEAFIRESRRVAKDGRVLQVRGSYSALRDESGKVVGLSQIIQDITAVKQVESARTALADIIASSNDAILSRNLDGVVLSWNAGAERMFGYTAAEMIGKHIEVALPTGQPSNVLSNNEAVARGEAFNRETNRKTKDGRIIAVRGSYSPLRDESGNTVGVSLIMQDITALKQAESARSALEAQLREAQKMQAIGTLAGGIAHDFNNIIAAIMGNTDLARDDAAGNEPVLESLGEISKAARRARDLVQQILSFSRRQPTELKSIALEPIVLETSRLLRATLPKRISLDTRCQPDVPTVLADATQMQQALINLSTNAVHAMPGPGRLTITLDTVMLDEETVQAHPALGEIYARHPGLVARITVTDTGTGMDKATLERIFEPFFTTKATNEGTGLGLAVVHGIVQGHGGALTVASEPGKGTRFSLYFPVTDAPQARDALRDTHRMRISENAGKGRRVLYVDDDSMLLHMVTRILSRRGFEVSAHTNQAEALVKLRADPTAFDLVLTDYNMPEMSGLEVARRVREIRDDIPVVVTSGFIDDALTAQAREAGVRELISKADSAAELCDAVQRLTQNWL